eukprot:7309190-Prymnesium_polylepis.2
MGRKAAPRLKKRDGGVVCSCQEARSKATVVPTLGARCIGSCDTRGALGVSGRGSVARSVGEQQVCSSSCCARQDHEPEAELEGCAGDAGSRRPARATGVAWWARSWQRGSLKDAMLLPASGFERQVHLLSAAMPRWAVCNPAVFDTGHLDADMQSLLLDRLRGKCATAMLVDTAVFFCLSLTNTPKHANDHKQALTRNGC